MFSELLRVRRSVRTFTDKPLSGEHMEQITEALLRSPTSRNICPWRFHLTTDPAIIKKLAAAKQHGSAFLAGAACAVVITGDENASDVWVEDCSIAAIVVQLLTTDLGLGSCWAQIRKRPHDAQTSAEEYVQHLLALPTNERVGMIIGIGHPAEHPEPVPEEKLKRDRLRFIPENTHS